MDTWGNSKANACLKIRNFGGNAFIRLKTKSSSRSFLCKFKFVNFWKSMDQYQQCFSKISALLTVDGNGLHSL